MPNRIDEAVDVTLAPNGEPRAFIWRRFEYEVVGVPQAFYRRLAWWQSPGDPSRIDHELWRVEASDTGLLDDARTYDLARSPDDAGAWVLETAWE